MKQIMVLCAMIALGVALIAVVNGFGANIGALSDAAEALIPNTISAPTL